MSDEIKRLLAEWAVPGAGRPIPWAGRADAATIGTDISYIVRSERGIPPGTQSVAATEHLQISGVLGLVQAVAQAQRFAAGRLLPGRNNAEASTHRQDPSHVGARQVQLVPPHVRANETKVQLVLPMSKPVCRPRPQAAHTGSACNWPSGQIASANPGPRHDAPPPDTPQHSSLDLCAALDSSSLSCPSLPDGSAKHVPRRNHLRSTLTQREPEDFEQVLSALANDIQSRQTRLADIRRRERSSTFFLTFYLLAFWVAYVLVWYGTPGALPTLGSRAGAGWDRALKGAPVVIGPVMFVCSSFSLCSPLTRRCSVLFMRRIVQLGYQRIGNAEGVLLALDIRTLALYSHSLLTQRSNCRRCTRSSATRSRNSKRRPTITRHATSSRALTSHRPTKAPLPARPSAPTALLCAYR
jgi:hypothetical protein